MRRGNADQSVVPPLSRKHATAARSRFEVALKFAGPLPVSERNGGFDAPGAELRSVRDFASIVPAQPSPQVIGQANIEMFPIQLALKDVNV
jgi:hypothetical protein